MPAEAVGIRDGIDVTIEDLTVTDAAVAGEPVCP